MNNEEKPTPQEEEVSGIHGGPSQEKPEPHGEDRETESGTDAAAEEISPLDKALLKITELEDSLARRNADLYNLRQEYGNYVKRAKQEQTNAREQGIGRVLEALLGVLDNAHLAREHGDLTGGAGKVVDELEQTLRTNFNLERFGAVGDKFDPQLHEALMHQTSSDVESEQVAQLIQLGYRQGEKILRPARVGVVSPQ